MPAHTLEVTAQQRTSDVAEVRPTIRGPFSNMGKGCYAVLGALHMIV